MSQYNLNPLSAKSCAKFACFIAGFLRLRFVVTALLVAFGLMSAQAVMAQAVMPQAPLNMKFINNTLLPDKDVWITFQNPSKGLTDFDVTYSGTPVSFALPSNLMSTSVNLHQIGTAGFSITRIVSNPIFVSYGAPLLSTIAAPAYVNPQGLDYMTRFQSFELTRHPIVSDQGNLTAINFFTAPMRIQSYHQESNNSFTLLQETGYTKNATTIAASLDTATNGNPNAVVKDATGKVIRYIGPSAFDVTNNPYKSFLPYVEAVRTAGQTTQIENSNGFLNTTTMKNYIFTLCMEADILLDNSISISGSITTKVIQSGSPITDGPTFAGLTMKIDAHEPGKFDNVIYYQADNETQVITFNDWNSLKMYMQNEGFSQAVAEENLSTTQSLLIGEITTGLLGGFVNSDYVPPGGGTTPVKNMKSLQWWSLTAIPLPKTLQPTHEYYNVWAEVILEASSNEVYSVPYSDRFGSGPLVNSVQYGQEALSVDRWVITLDAPISLPTKSISGTVTNSSGSVESGVTMTLSGTSTGTATTDANGAYSFSNLINGTYVITPVLADYTFSPPDRTVSISNADQTGINFTATAIIPNTFTISGTVTNSSGSVESGVTMSLTGTSIQTATTHTDGTYHFGNLEHGTYTVTPTPTDDHTFQPKSKSITVGPSATAENFTATPASLGTLVAHGLDFPIYASELNPPEVTFMNNPVVHARYLHDGKSAETKLKVLTKVDKNTGSPSINSLWTKRIKLYNPKDFKEAQKNGSGALDWLANSANQSRLLMDLYLKAKDVEDQMIGQLTLEEPVISNITAGLDANDNEVLTITGNWFGTTDVRCWREFTAEGGSAIKQQKMNVVKANNVNYKDRHGKPAHMNSITGSSLLIVRVPKKDPKGTLNNVIVINNGVGMAAYSLISIPPQPSTENNDSIIVRSGKPTVPSVEGGVQNQSGAMYSNTNAYSNGTQSLAVGVEQQWIGYGQPLDNVAVNWMTCFNFSPLERAMSGNQKLHQPEGIAKLMDIVQLYGWNGINASYTNSIGADTETLFSDDDKVLQLCKSMGKDLRPLLYFWGILPANSANLAAQVAAAGLTPPIEIRDLLYHYKALVPADNAAFRSFCMNYYGHQPSMGGLCFEQDHARQWSTDLLWSPDVQLSEPYQVRFPTEIYDETASAEVKARVQEIINMYWNPADLNFDSVVNGTDLALMLSESWGPCGTNCRHDLNLDGFVNGADFNLMMSAWGSTTN
ncbi:MAG: carboxypeptidase regulatory-like domain-containing protein [Planctomycetota bacterium]|nr:carboxypeptidase regulatory-like domain-containing protein [Planctomycetota bacterium]